MKISIFSSKGLELAGKGSPVRTILNPVLSFLTGEKKDNNSQAEESIELLRETSSKTFSTICQNLQTIRQHANEGVQVEVIVILQENVELATNLTTLTNSTWAEMRSQTEVRERVATSNLAHLQNLSEIATKIGDLLERHHKVEEERGKQEELKRNRNNNRTRTQITISITMERSQLAEVISVYIDREAAACKEVLDSVKEGNHPVWACLTFAIMLGPGLIVCFYMVTSGFLKNITPIEQTPKWFQQKLFLLGMISTFIFPIGVLLTQFFELFIIWLASINTDPSKRKEYDDMLKTIRFITQVEAAIEAFFESVPQLVLQTYIIAATKEATKTQIITITFSMVMLAKTTILYDLMYNSTGVDRMERPLRTTAKYLVAVLPLYVTSAIFKVNTITIIFVFYF